MHHTVREVSLKNGVKGLLINVPQATVMSFDFNLRAGFYLAPEGKWETPHIMEHLMVGANKQYRKSRLFEAEIKQNGAYNNAYTSTYNMGYVAECAEFEWQRILNLTMLSMSQPLFLQAEFEAEVGNVKEELKGYLSDYFRQLGVAIGQRLGYRVLPYKESLKQIPDITIQDIRNFYKKTHKLENVRFAIAGNLKGKRDDIVQTIERKLKLPHGERIPLPETAFKSQEGPLYIENKTVESLYVSFAMVLPRRISDPEFDALMALNNILSSTHNSLILGDLREKGLAYYIWSSGSRGADYTIWEFDFQVSQENAKKAMRIIVRHLKSVLAAEITLETLRASKKYALGSFQLGDQTVASILNGYNYAYGLTGEIVDYDRIPERIMGVTTKRVVKIAQNFHEENTWELGVLGCCGQEVASELHEELRKLWA